MALYNENQLRWDDLPEIAATVTNLNDTIDQCVIQVEGEPQMHLFLLNDGLLSIIDVSAAHDAEPSDDLLLSLGRVLVAHKSACRDGRRLS